MTYYPNSVTYPEGPDYDDCPEQPRCVCGAFLSWEPTISGGEVIVVTPEYPLWDQAGNFMGTEKGQPFEEIAPAVWICKRCGRSN